MKAISRHFGLNGVNPDYYGGWEGWLFACCNDARTMAGTMARAGYESAALLNERCTKEALRLTFKEAAAVMEAGDWFVFSYSGHGGQENRALIGTRETLCLYDGQIADDEIHALMSLFKPGVNVVIILDSCHSGGVRSIGKISRLAPTFICKRFPPTDAPIPRGSISADIVILSACDQNETAADGNENGAFTGSLLLTLANYMCWGDLGDQTASYMLKNFPEQHPQIAHLGPSANKVLDASVFLG